MADDEQTENGSEHWLLLNGESVWSVLVGRPPDGTPGGGVAACRGTESCGIDSAPVLVVTPIFGVRTWTIRCHGPRRRVFPCCTV